MSNLYTFFQERFPAEGEKRFLSSDQGTTLTYAQLESASAQLANYFLQSGLKKGDRVAVQVEKSPAVLLVYLASLRAGLIYLPLNTGYTMAERHYFLSDAKPAMVITDPCGQETFTQLLAELDLTAKLETLDQDGAGSVITASQGCDKQFDTVPCDADDIAAILYTSGTTGQPKGAMLSHGNLASNAAVLHTMWGWTADDVLLHILPIFHVHGLFVACHGVLAAGASMHFLSKFNEQAAIDALASSTVMMGVPTHYTRLLACEHFDATACATMRLFISGSAPMLASTHQAFIARTGQSILERYGMTETAMLVSNPLQGERRPGTVGMPLPRVELRIVDDQGLPVDIDTIGSIQVKGPNIFKGYWRKPEKTAQEFTADGFFITGDQGTWSEDGYVSIVGRSKDMVITGGLNVYPKEVELVLDAIEQVKESAVFGVANVDLGEVVSAAVVCTAPCQQEHIIARAKEKLSAYKVPRRIVFVDELPRNTMGKVQKNLLRQQYAGTDK